MKKLKKSIATILGVSILTLGGIQLSINIDSNKFWTQAEKGELYITYFNTAQYKVLRPELIKEMRNQKPNPQMKSLWVQAVDRETKIEKWYFEAKPGKTIDVNSPEFIQMLNNKLEEIIK